MADKNLTIEESITLQALAIRVLDGFQEMERQLAALHGDPMPLAYPPLVKVHFDYRKQLWKFEFRGTDDAGNSYSIAFPGPADPPVSSIASN